MYLTLLPFPPSSLPLPLPSFILLPTSRPPFLPLSSSPSPLKVDVFSDIYKKLTGKAVTFKFDSSYE